MEDNAKLLLLGHGILYLEIRYFIQYAIIFRNEFFLKNMQF